MKFLNLTLMASLFALFAAQAALATVGTPSTPLPLLVESRLNDSALSAPIVKLGTQVTQKKVNVLKAVYDFAVLGGASGSSIILKDASGGDATLPKNAIVKRVTISRATTLTAAQTNATLAFGTDALAANFKAATTFSTFNTGEGLTDGIPVGSSATSLRIRDYNMAVGMKIGVAPITAGKLVVYIEYYIGAPNE